MNGNEHTPIPPRGLRGALSRLRRLLSTQPNVTVKERPRFTLTQGSVQPDEANFLRVLVEQANDFDGPIIEIGTLFGMTTTRLAQWKRAGKRLITVDNFGWNPLELTSDEHYELTKGVLSYLIAVQDVELLKQGKSEFYASYTGPGPALVFLDAIHSYEETKRDIEWAIRVGAQIISGHDYSPEFPGVVRAVEECGGLQDKGGTVWQLKSR